MWTRELKTRVNACNIRGVVLHSKQSEDSWQKECGLSRRSREEPCSQCSTKLWQLHERSREKLCTKPRKLHEGSGKESTVQHKAVKVTRTTWRRVAMIVLHGAVSIGVGTGGLGGQFSPNILLCIKELTVIQDWYLTNY